MDDLHDWLALHNALHGTPRSLQLLLQKFESPKNILDIFKKTPNQLKLTPIQTERLKKINQKQVALELKWAEKPTHHIITFYDPAYPPLLKETYDPPILLFASGVMSVYCCKFRNELFLGGP